MFLNRLRALAVVSQTVQNDIIKVCISHPIRQFASFNDDGNDDGNRPSKFTSKNNRVGRGINKKPPFSDSFLSASYQRFESMSHTPSKYKDDSNRNRKLQQLHKDSDFPHIKRQNKVLNFVNSYKQQEKQQQQQQQQQQQRNLNKLKVRDSIHSYSHKRFDSNKHSKDYAKTQNQKNSKKAKSADHPSSSSFAKSKRSHCNDEHDNDDSSKEDDDNGPPLPQWDQIELKEIKWDFYQPNEITKNRSNEEMHEFHKKHNITVSKNSPKPMLTFEELNIPENLKNEVRRQNFSEVTPIAAQAWPIALSGKSMLGIAQTGSGKTLAFILPTVMHILNQAPLKRGDGPIALILVPTSELAQQIQLVATQFGITSQVRNSYLCESTPIARQMPNIETCCELLISTPDQLSESLGSPTLNLHRCSFLVLYEADRMLEMGFEPDLRQIIPQIRPDRQMLIWNTALHKDVNRLAKDFLSEYSHLNMGTRAISLSENHNVKQIVKVCSEKLKNNVLLEIVDLIDKLDVSQRKTIVFTETKVKANQVVNILNRKSVVSKAIHNDKSQYECEQTLEDFRHDRIHFLVVTDVAARSLSFNGVSNLINYDYPFSTTDYMLRIIRSRLGQSNSATGTAYTLFTEENGNEAANLIALLKESSQPIEPALLILNVANIGPDEEVLFAVPSGKGYNRFQIESRFK